MPTSDPSARRCSTAAEETESSAERAEAELWEAKRKLTELELGKTTLAHIIAREMGGRLTVTSGPALEKGGDLIGILTHLEEGDVLFVDEIHRFNKAQQDAFLHHVESGLITLIGATTENPYFEVNKALVSRSRIFQLVPLGAESMRQIVHQALDHAQCR